MCVLICRVGEKPLLAANRDEVYARPFSAPRAWVSPVVFWAPRDEDEGGTWIGVNAAGVVAAITNLSRLEAIAGRPSRGHLVAGLLRHERIDDARGWLESELAGKEHNPCQLLCMQRGVAWVCRVDGAEFSVSVLAPGIHALSNLHDSDEIDFGLAADAGWAEIQPVLADRSARLPRGYSVCKDAGWRGTVASALIEPGERFLFADGPPDEAEYLAVPGYA